MFPSMRGAAGKGDAPQASSVAAARAAPAQGTVRRDVRSISSGDLTNIHAGESRKMEQARAAGDFQKAARHADNMRKINAEQGRRSARQAA